MATADEILSQLASEDDKVLVINNDLRTITIPQTVKMLGVESDEEVLRLYFRMPKMYGDTDLSEFVIRINYINAKGTGDVYTVSDSSVTDDAITFSWLISRSATIYKGSVRFIVCLKLYNGTGVLTKEYNTTVASLPVLEGLEIDNVIIDQNPRIIEDILLRLNELENGGPKFDWDQNDESALDYIKNRPFSRRLVATGTSAISGQGAAELATDVPEDTLVVGRYYAVYVNGVFCYASECVADTAFGYPTIYYPGHSSWGGPSIYLYYWSELQTGYLRAWTSGELPWSAAGLPIEIYEVTQIPPEYLAVQSVNGKTGAVQLTADDVGAVSSNDLQAATEDALAKAKASGEFDGADGQSGADGKSAYQYAVEGGYTGTEAEFAAKLAQEKFANPNALTFTGAVTGSYDGSAPMSVKIPSGGAISDEWVDLGTLALADGEEANNFKWEVDGLVKKIHVEGVYYSATSGKNLTLLNESGDAGGGLPVITYNVFPFPSSAETAMYMDITIEELYPGYWIGVGGASTFNTTHGNLLSSYSNAKRVDRYISLGEYWRSAALTAGTSFNVKVVYY